MSDRHDPSDETGVTLTRTLVDTLVEEYGRREPFDLVEREHIETLPRAFASREFGRRDAEWVVQWYYRRRSIPDADRRAAETRFRENDFDAIVDTLHGATTAPDRETKLERVTSLTGVDLDVASAFLAFMHPAEYVAVGDREWQTLHEVGELDTAAPKPVTAADYGRYLGAVGSVAERVGRDRWSVYRAVWRLGTR